MSELKLKRITISKNSVDERFDLDLTDSEWMIVKSKISSNWNTMDCGLEEVIIKMIRNSLIDSGFKASLQNDRLTFIRTSS